MKKSGLILVALLAMFIGMFIWALSGASDNQAPTDVRTIDVSPAL